MDRNRFERKAVEIHQGNLTLYHTFLTPMDLFESEHRFFDVSILEPNAPGKGYQRILNEARAKRLSEHMVTACKEGYAHLPTAVFLATDKELDYCEATSTLSFDKSNVCPFGVVDGQHRLEGLRRAAETDLSLKVFQLPSIIASNLDSLHQMLQFYMVNTTQVPVDPSLRQQITRIFSDTLGVRENLPFAAIPKWLQQELTLGLDAKALRVVEYLNNEPSSPLRGRIHMANESPKTTKGKIKQSSMVNVMKGYIFNDGRHPLATQISDARKVQEIILNYFIAVDHIFVDGRDREKTTIYKSGGLRFLLGASKWVFGTLMNHYPLAKRYTVASMENCIRRALEEIDDGSRHIADPDWYMPESKNREKANYVLTTVMARYYADDVFWKAIVRANDQ